MSTRTARITSTRLAAAALTAAALLLTGCGGDDPATTTAETATSASEPAASDQSGDQVSAEHNEADTMFARSMVPHHRQAIQMSDVLLEKDGVDERVVTLARQIEAAQQPEIDRMIGFLETWGEQGPDDDMGSDDMGSDHDSGYAMNGMMSDDDMERLEDAQGVEAARLFLEQMTLHHAGAVEMARTELDRGQNPQALELAQAIVDTQEAEVTEMQDILASL